MVLKSKKRVEPPVKIDGTLEERLRTIFGNTLGVDEEELTLEAKVRGNFYTDSLDETELICAIEDELDVSIDDETDVEDLTTFGDWVKMVEGLLA